MAYKQGDDYAWYKRGQNGERHDNTPPFELNENGEVKLAPGELYCRHETEPGRLCPNNAS